MFRKERETSGSSLRSPSASLGAGSRCAKEAGWLGMRTKLHHHQQPVSLRVGSGSEPFFHNSLNRNAARENRFAGRPDPVSDQLHCLYGFGGFGGPGGYFSTTHFRRQCSAAAAGTSLIPAN